MNPTPIEFQFHGPHADADARELAELLARELPDCPARLEPRPPPAPNPHTRDATTLATIALVLSVTQTSLELADRFKLAEKLTRLIQWAKARRARRQPVPAVIVPPHALQVPLDQAKPEQLAEALASPDPKPPPP